MEPAQHNHRLGSASQLAAFPGKAELRITSHLRSTVLSGSGSSELAGSLHGCIKGEHVSECALQNKAEGSKNLAAAVRLEHIDYLSSTHFG